MKITGIIAEYNPFHNGHAYQIAKIKEETDSDYVIVAMSGDFVQRGEPAITDKYERARMALSCGADLVLELPALFACASAEYFARAGVALFTRMGCVDYLCFGAENADLSQLNKIAGILVDEPRSYQDALNIYLKEGKNFPAARILALKSYLSAESSDAALQTEQLTSLLSTPNNILGIEYLKALKTCGSQITPYPILREGAGYHDTDILLKNASASAIRQTLKQAGSSGSSSGSAPDFASFSAAMPQEAFRIFSEYLASSTYLEADDFSGILNYLLLFYPAEALACFADCNIEIANRLKKNRSAFSSFTQFAALNQSRDITYARMSRIFTHILLHMTAEDYKQAKQLGYVPYLRPLGFKKSSSDVLGEIKKHTDIPLIGKLANARQTLSDDAFRLLEKDIFAADLYEQVLAQKNSPGGSVTAGMAIYDTMQHVKCDVSTICVGLAASMGAFLLAGGTSGKRFSLPNAEIMIHQPSGGAKGQATDIQIAAQNIQRTKNKLNELLAANTGRTLEEVTYDTDRDNFMSAEEALEYGLIDQIIQ